MALEPGLDLRVLMRGVVVLDQMDVEVLGRLAIDLLEEAQPFDMRVARLGACNQFALQRRSFESLKVLVICGFSSFFDQIRCTVLCDIPT